MNNNFTYPDSKFPKQDRLPEQLTVVIPVIEEQLAVTKELIETGRLKITKQITESNDTADISLIHDEYKVEHKAINLLVVDDTIPAIRYEGNSTIIPVLKEVMVKRTLLVEEIWITMNRVTTTEQQQVVLKKEVVTVEHMQ